MHSNRARRHALSATILAAAITLTPGAVSAGETSSPPESSSHGLPLAQWLATWWAHALDGATGQEVNNVRLMEIPAGVYTGGSGTAADPALFVDSIEVTMRPGTPFIMPVALWYGERYDPEATGGLQDDAVLPAGVFTGSNVHITMDGEDVINSEVDDLSRWYTGPTYYDEPLFYPEPTGYGSIATLYVQGLAFLHRPLTPGTHVMHLESEIIAAIPDYYGNGIALDLGQRWQNTWTIHVEP